MMAISNDMYISFLAQGKVNERGGYIVHNLNHNTPNLWR